MFNVCPPTHESPGTRREAYVSSPPDGMDASIELPHNLSKSSSVIQIGNCSCSGGRCSSIRFMKVRTYSLTSGELLLASVAMCISRRI